MKKFISLLCMMMCVFSLAACGSTVNDQVQITEEELADFADFFDVYTQSVTEFDAPTIALYQANADNAQIAEMLKGYGATFDTWLANAEEVGDYIGYDDFTAEIDGNEIVMSAKADFSKRDAEIKMTVAADGYVTYYVINPIYTKGEQMSKAGINTLIGIMVVFTILVLISLLIYCFKFINKFETALKNRKNKKNGSEVAQSVDNVVAQIAQKEEDELVDDTELVAVIAAAIAAYTGSSTDGFVVRSIRKSNKNKWKNA